MKSTQAELDTMMESEVATLTVGYTDGSTDGSTETIDAGEAFYLPPGHHRVFTDTGCLVAEFSPAAEMAAVMEELGSLLAE